MTANEDLDLCRIEEISGEPVRVLGSGNLSPEDREALADIIYAAREKLRREDVADGGARARRQEAALARIQARNANRKADY